MRYLSFLIALVILYLKIFRLSSYNLIFLDFVEFLYLKELIFVYAAQLTIDRIQMLIREKGLVQKHVLEECGMNENTLKRMTDNKGMSSFYLAKIADYLNCSVDYLLGRVDNKEISKSELTDLEQELLEKFNYLLDVDKGRILDRMTTIYESYSPEQKENVS